MNTPIEELYGDDRLLAYGYQKDPYRIIADGLCILKSDHKVDRVTMQPTQIGAHADQIVPYIMKEPQRRIFDLQTKRQAQGRSLRMIFLKARFLGITTHASATIAARVGMRSGFKAHTITHKPGTDHEIYSWQKMMLSRFPPILRPKKYKPDNSEETKLSNPDLPEPVSESTIKCVASTNIQRLHGDRAHIVLVSEVARLEDPDEYVKAAGGIWFDGPGSEYWLEGTANGVDAILHPNFTKVWDSQGGVNYWEQGYEERAEVAFFLPAYQDPRKRRALPKGMSIRDFVSRWDDYEKATYINVIHPYWTRVAAVKRSAEEALYLACLHYSWRRSRLALIKYRDWEVAESAGESFYKESQYNQQEPNTPTEAFSTSTGDLLLADQDRAWLKSKTSMDFRSGLWTPQGWETTNKKEQFCRIWEFPDEVHAKGMAEVVASFDGAGGTPDPEAYRSDREPELKRDFNWGVIFRLAEDPETKAKVAIQVAEYVSQCPAHLACQHFMDLVMAYRLHGPATATNEPDQWPRLSWESQYGSEMANEARRREYPVLQTYRRLHEDRVNRKPDDYVGFHNNRNSGIAASIQMQRRVQTRSVVIRSPFLVKQFDWYQEGPAGKYEAAQKGKGGEQSKDDGADAACQLVYVWNYGEPPQGAIVRDFTHNPGDTIDLDMRSPRDGRDVRKDIEAIQERLAKSFDGQGNPVATPDPEDWMTPSIPGEPLC